MTSCRSSGALEPELHKQERPPREKPRHPVTRQQPPLTTARESPQQPHPPPCKQKGHYGFLKNEQPLWMVEVCQ